MELKRASDEDAKVIEANLNKLLRGELPSRQITYSCKSCGAISITDDPSKANLCSACKSKNLELNQIAIDPNDKASEITKEILAKENLVKALRNKFAKEEAELKNNVLLRLAAGERGEATELIVNYIKDNNYIFTTRDDNKPEVWLYRNGIYIPNGISYIKEICRMVLDRAFTTHIANDVVNKIMADTYIEIEKFFGTNYKEEIAVLNGVLNVVTRKLSSFAPEKIFFSKCPVSFNPNAKCDVIDSFLSEILADPEDKKVYYEIGGFCLLKEYTWEKSFMFLGNGRNGKGKALELIKRVIGAENTISLPLAALSHENADVSQLWTKMVNLAGDIGFADLKDTSMFKALTGRDYVTAKRKYKTAIVFENYAKFVFACNDLPKVYDTSMGFWDRWVLLEYPFYFAEREKWEKANEEDRKKWKIRDENIIDKIATPEQLSGLLNAFLDGLARLMENGKFSTTKGSEEVKNMWIRKSDSFAAFCLDTLEEKYDGVILKKDIRKKYAEYCKKHKLRNASDKVIKTVLETEFGANESKKTITPGSYDLEYVWEGITWKK